MRNPKTFSSAAQEAEPNWRLIVDRMPGFAWSSKADGGLEYLSPPVLEFTGQPLEEVLRFGWVALIHPEDADRLLDRWMHSVRTGELFDAECRVRRFDGTYHWFKASARPAVDANGRIARWFGTAFDIDELITTGRVERLREVGHT
jgi:PAS domain S-box-containing protein